MQEMVSVNGRPFNIWYESLNERNYALKNAESQCIDCGLKTDVISLAPSGPSSKIVGQTLNITSNPTGGTSPYAYTFWKILDNAPAGTTPTVIGTANQASNQVYYTLVEADIGPLRIGVDIQDSCPTGAHSNTETWLINVGPACTDPVANLVIA